MVSRALSRMCVSATLFLGASLVASLPASAGTISITYSFAGGLTAPPVVSGGFLILSGASTGSVNQFNPLVNAVWNPVSLNTSDKEDLATGLDNGTFSMTFANGDMLSGLLFEDLSRVDRTAVTGPFTQTLTFTAGTGEFLGVTGFGAGIGSVAPTGFTSSGSGFLSAPGLITPEPASTAWMFGGLAFMVFRYRLRRTN